MKKRLLSLLTVLTMLVTLLPAGMLTASAAETTTILCVGDSITWGSHATQDNQHRYTDWLGRWLGSDYTVVNCGSSGATMGAHPTNQYKYGVTGTGGYHVDSKTVESADIAIIMLGTNDASLCWDMNDVETSASNYITGYQAMIAQFREWNPDLRFILATPPTSCDLSYNYWPNERLDGVANALREFYAETYQDDPNFRLIDINQKTKPWNDEHKDWYDDNVHYNDVGYEQLARLFYEELWDTTVHSFTIDGGDYTVKIDDESGSIGILADPEDLKGKTATITVATNSKTTATLSLDKLPTTLTVTADYDGVSREHFVYATAEETDLEKTLIYTEDQLKALQGKTLTGEYKLMENITVTGDWTPITSLSGTFDGNGKTIEIHTTATANNYGLFTTVAADGSVKNLTIDGEVNGNQKNNVGVLAYENRGIIENCINKANLIGSGRYGAGLVSQNYGLINRCGNEGDVTGSGDYLGGLAANMQSNSVVANSYNTGAVTNTANGAGGIAANAGRVGSSGYPCTIINCYNTGDITGNNGVTGGIAGDSNNLGLLTMTNVWNTGKITVSGGGTPNNELVGRDGPVLKADHILSTATAADAIAVLNANLLNSFTYGGVTYDLNKWAEGDTPALTEETVTALIRDENGVYHLRTEEHLLWFAANVNSQRGLNAILDEDITLTGDWTPMSAYPYGYMGVFDGNGHAIKGLKINSTTQRAGLFAYVTGGTIKDLMLEDVQVLSTNSMVGALVGELAYGTLSGINVTGSVEATFGANACLGGIVGSAGSATGPVVIENCVNKADVTLHYTETGNNVSAVIGGIVGNTPLTLAAGSVIRGCGNTGSVGYTSENGGSPQRVGGIVGCAGLSVLNCWNTGAVSGASCVGGIVGDDYITGIYIANCWNTGNITAASNYGGIVGRVYPLGGNMTYVYNCFTTTATWGANVTGTCDFLYTGAQVSNTAEFVRLLNNFVIEHKDDEAYTALGGLSKWAKSEDMEHPVQTGELPTDKDEPVYSSLIETVDQLLAINGQNGDYTLVEDIVVNEADVSSNTLNYLIASFDGTLKGAGHSITINCNKMLFNQLNANALVKDLTVKATINLPSANKIAPVVSTCYGTVENCTFSGSVTANQYVGGIVSSLEVGGEIRNCQTTADTTITANAGYVGGITGTLKGTEESPSQIVGSTNRATVLSSSANFCGGISGYFDGPFGVIDSSTNSGAVEAIGYVAGIVGGTYTGNMLLITNCRNEGSLSLTSTNSYIGGIMGGNVGSLQLYVINSSSVGTIAGGNGLVGLFRGGAYLANSYTYNVQNMGPYYLLGTPKTTDAVYAWRGVDQDNIGTPPYQGRTQATMQSMDFVLTLDNYQPDETIQALLKQYGITLRTWEYVAGATPVLGEDELGSKGQLEYDGDVMLIANELQLMMFANKVASDRALSGRLTADITLTKDWTPMATNGYRGAFDGNGHAIKGLKINSTVQRAGLFAYVTGGTIKDLTLEDVQIASVNSMVGALVGELTHGTLSGINVTGSVEATFGANACLGGIVGSAGSATGPVVIENCVNEATVTLHYTGTETINALIGGIVGNTSMTPAAGSVIRGCGNTGTVGYTSENGGKLQRVGGIVGYAGLSVLNCWNTGAVSGASCIGGIVGDSYVTGIYIANCWNTGSVTAISNYGGIVGRVYPLGGNMTYVYNCFTTTDSWGTNNGGTCDFLYTGAQVSNTADFVQTLNDFVLDHRNDEVYTALGGLSIWAVGEDHPVLTGELPGKSVTVKFTGKQGVLIAEKTAFSVGTFMDLLNTVKAPAMGGYICAGWGDSPEDMQAMYEAAADGDVLSVYAVYEVDTATTYDITVTNATADKSTGLTFDSRVTVTATGDDNPTYWLLDGAKVGFGQNSYTFYVSGNNNIAAVAEGETSTDPEVVLQQATWASDSEGKYTLTAIAQTSIPAGNSVSEYGVIFTSKEPTTAFLSDPASAVVKVKSSKTGANLQYMAHLLNVKVGRTRYARAYAIVDGVTIYSATAVQFKTAASGVTTDVRAVA
jgi:lysophospholipase L1-like esterase